MHNRLLLYRTKMLMSCNHLGACVSVVSRKPVDVGLIINKDWLFIIYSVMACFAANQTTYMA